MKIIGILCQRIIPNFNELSESEEGTVNEALATCSHYLTKKPFNWCKSARMVAVESFCANFLIGCCDSVVPNEETFDWIPKRTKWFKGACKVYSVLRRGNNSNIVTVVSGTLRVAEGLTLQANR